MKKPSERERGEITFRESLHPTNNKYDKWRMLLLLLFDLGIMDRTHVSHSLGKVDDIENRKAQEFLIGMGIFAGSTSE